MRKGGVGWVVLMSMAAGGLSTAHAGPNANAKILLHLLAPTTKNVCGRSDATPNCSGIVTAGGFYPQSYFAYLLVADGDSVAGIAGVQCGVSYNGTPNAGVDVYSWTNCATLEFTSTGWPDSGGGNLITWDKTTRCQRFEPDGPGTGVLAVAGYFYCAAYGADTLRVVPRPVDGLAKVADCAALEDTVASAYAPATWVSLGRAVFSLAGDVSGWNPCADCDDPFLTGTARVPTDENINIDLGTLEPTRGATKRVFVRGKELTPPFRLHFSNGVFYINNTQCIGAVGSGQTNRMTAASRGALDLRAMGTQSLATLFEDVPTVQASLGRGSTLLDAATAYYARVLSNLDEVARVYQSVQEKSGVLAAEQAAVARIDKDIAEAREGVPRGPQFSADGRIRLYFHGFGYHTGGAFSSRGVAPPPREPQPIVAQQALALEAEFRRYLMSPSPAVVIYSSTATILAAGADAEKIITQIDAAMRGAEPGEDHGLLNSRILGEIVREARR